MSATPNNPNSSSIVRIIHYSNLEYILQTGIVSAPNHKNANPNYRSIGNNEIVLKRSNKKIPTHPDCTFRDFVGFYIGKRSIMLYNIITGYGEISKVPQGEIIYLVFNITDTTVLGYDYFFTDVHALKYPLTQFYSDLEDWDKLDQTAINASDFSADAQHQYPDLKRKKQAEFHFHNELNFSDIAEIVVLTCEKEEEIRSLLSQYSYQTTVRIDLDYYCVR